MINVKQYGENLFEIASSKTIIFVEVINENVIRVYEKKSVNDLTNYKLQYKKAKFCSDINNVLSFSTKNYSLTFDENNNISFAKNNVLIFKINCFGLVENHISDIEIFDDNHIYGLGDKLNSLDKRGYYYESYNSDIATRHDELTPALYKSVNLLLLERGTEFIGLYYPSTYKYSFDLCRKHLNHIEVNSEKANYDVFIFLNKKLQDIITDFSYMCGHPYFIRMKMLGNNQSRYSYASEDEVVGVLNNHIRNKIPLDYIHLDIDYMDKYKVLTIDKERFSDMSKLSKKCKDANVELIAITDAGVKKEDGYFVYDYLHKNNLFCKLNNEEYTNVVWPGESAFPNYFDKQVQKFFKEETKKFILNNGISGIWNDMNEPATFKGDLPLDVDMSYGKRLLLNDEGHNLYAEKMSKVAFDTFKELNLRPYVFTRGAFATTSKYAFVWNGDNFSLWHHLKASLPQVMTLSLCNFMFNGDDIGGFGGDGNKQILLRWAEANILFPFFRNHSSLYTVSQEPYAFDEETLCIYKKMLDLRYSFIPYLYNLCYMASKKGKLIVGPLFYYNQLNKFIYDVDDEYMVGNLVLVAPILEKDKKERIVKFPEGIWIDYFTNKKYSGNKKYMIDMDIKDVGIYVKNNSIIPQFEKLTHIDKKNIDTLVLKIYGNKGKLELYDDDGESLDYVKGIYNIYSINYKNTHLYLTTKYQRYKTSYKYIKIIAENKEITCDFGYNIDIVI